MANMEILLEKGVVAHTHNSTYLQEAVYCHPV